MAFVHVEVLAAEESERDGVMGADITLAVSFAPATLSTAEVAALLQLTVDQLTEDLFDEASD